MFDYEESFYVEKEVAVSAEKTWEIISMPENLTLWHPFMDKHTAESWNGVDCFYNYFWNYAPYYTQNHKYFA